MRRPPWISSFFGATVSVRSLIASGLTIAAVGATASTAFSVRGSPVSSAMLATRPLGGSSSSSSSSLLVHLDEIGIDGLPLLRGLLGAGGRSLCDLLRRRLGLFFVGLVVGGLVGLFFLDGRLLDVACFGLARFLGLAGLLLARFLGRADLLLARFLGLAGLLRAGLLGLARLLGTGLLGFARRFRACLLVLLGLFLAGSLGAASLARARSFVARHPSLALGAAATDRAAVHAHALRRTLFVLLGLVLLGGRYTLGLGLGLDDLLLLLCFRLFLRLGLRLALGLGFRLALGDFLLRLVCFVGRGLLGGRRLVVRGDVAIRVVGDDELVRIGRFLLRDRSARLFDVLGCTTTRHPQGRGA